MTGAYIGHVVHGHSRISPRSVARNSTERRRELIAKAKQLGPILGPVGTAVAAVVTGIGDYLGDDSTILEQAPLVRMANEGQVHAYLHDGFWQCMDTYREQQMLDKMYVGGQAPWKVW